MARPVSRTAAVRRPRATLWPAVLVLLAGLFLSGCAARPPAPETGPVGCAPAADAAVDRGDWEGALAAHERRLSAVPDDCLAMYHLGFIWGHLGDREREVKWYEAAAECGYTGDAQLFFNLGMAYGELGFPDHAIDALARAVSIDPGNPDNHFGLGLALEAVGRMPQAEKALLKAVEVDPEHGEAHLALARMYLDQSRWDAAGFHLDRVDRIDPGNAEAGEMRELMQSRKALQYEN